MRSLLTNPVRAPGSSRTGFPPSRGVNGQPLNVRWRAVENGNRDSTDTNEQWQAVAGLKESYRTN